jgi:hypothetical protein
MGQLKNGPDKTRAPFLVGVPWILFWDWLSCLMNSLFRKFNFPQPSDNDDWCYWCQKGKCCPRWGLKKCAVPVTQPQKYKKNLFAKIPCAVSLLPSKFLVFDNEKWQNNLKKIIKNLKNAYLPTLPLMESVTGTTPIFGTPIFGSPLVNLYDHVAWCSSSSVSGARFTTAGRISLKFSWSVPPRNAHRRFFFVFAIWPILTRLVP